MVSRWPRRECAGAFFLAHQEPRFPGLNPTCLHSPKNFAMSGIWALDRNHADEAPRQGATDANALRSRNFSSCESHSPFIARRCLSEVLRTRGLFVSVLG